MNNKEFYNISENHIGIIVNITNIKYFIFYWQSENGAARVEVVTKGDDQSYAHNENATQAKNMNINTALRTIISQGKEM